MVEESEKYAEERLKKRSLYNDGSERDSKRQNTGGRPLLKLLIPNYAAGALLGKGGQLLHEMQNEYGGSVRLSSNRECYPGTDERIVVIMGEVDEIININKHIMERVQDPGPQSENLKKDEHRAQKVKIVLTSSAAGLLIGPKGVTVQAIQEECNVKISIATKEGMSELEERILTLSGSMDQRIEACPHIIKKVVNEPSNMSNTKLRYSSGDCSYAAKGITNIAHLPNTNRKPKLKIKAVATLEIPDIMVGAMLGKNGSVIRDLGVRSGAIFKFSEKNEFAAGTNNRTLTITGNMSQTATAYNLVNERIDKLGSQFKTELGGQSNAKSEYELGNQSNNHRHPSPLNSTQVYQSNDTQKSQFRNSSGFNNFPGSRFDNTPGSQFDNTQRSQFIPNSPFSNTPGSQFSKTPDSQFNNTPGSRFNNAPGGQFSNTSGSQFSNRDWDQY